MRTTLTGKQELFCQEYIANSFNASLAASLAGYKGTPNSLAVAGAKLVTNGKIKAEIERLKAVRRKKTGFTRELAEQKTLKIETLALKKGDLATALNAVKENKRLFGLDTDEKTLNINVKPPASPQERREQLMDELRLLDEADEAGTALAVT